MLPRMRNNTSFLNICNGLLSYCNGASISLMADTCFLNICNGLHSYCNGASISLMADTCFLNICNGLHGYCNGASIWLMTDTCFLNICNGLHGYCNGVSISLMADTCFLNICNGLLSYCNGASISLMSDTCSWSTSGLGRRIVRNIDIVSWSSILLFSWARSEINKFSLDDTSLEKLVTCSRVVLLHDSTLKFTEFSYMYFTM